MKRNRNQNGFKREKKRMNKVKKRNIGPVDLKLKG